ncbi:succinate dehydrogenase [Roseibaca sp. Y0-43]|uniref:succinate dehydrogenase n=1 Tax=Roseibaca sp. Y0-43 TaxID=2816854 RepID=UPI001D0C0B98|nr:succinate dehydrogenase [Roseibaca sp. Y0-43]
MIRAALLAAPLALSACAGVQDQLARDAAKRSVNPVLAERFPGVPLEPASDCVIDNASAGEITRLALAAAQPTVSPETSALVVEIATRPETIRCLATDGLAPFLM